MEQWKDFHWELQTIRKGQWIYWLKYSIKINKNNIISQIVYGIMKIFSQNFRKGQRMHWPKYSNKNKIISQKIYGNNEMTSSQNFRQSEGAKENIGRKILLKSIKIDNITSNLWNNEWNDFLLEVLIIRKGKQIYCLKYSIKIKRNKIISQIIYK